MEYQVDVETLRDFANKIMEKRYSKGHDLDGNEQVDVATALAGAAIAERLETIEARLAAVSSAISSN